MEFITCLGEVGACLLLCSSQPTSGGGCGKLAINSKLVVERTTARPLLPTSAELIFSKNITHLAHNEKSCGSGAKNNKQDHGQQRQQR